MVDLEVLSHFGVSAEGLKKKFNLPRSKRSGKVNTLVERIRSRVQAGRDHNIDRYQVYYALDQAWDSAFNQITPTLLSSLTDKSLGKDELLNTLKQWGMDPNEVMREIPDNKVAGQSIVKIDAPAFFRIFVPLVAAYVKIRWAKIINDRRLVPLLKYDPVISDEISRLKCSALTARVENMSRNYGYFDLLKQIVFRTLHYSECLQFPVEQWHTACSLVEWDSPFIAQEMVEFGGKKFKKIITKEGVRYHLPHPTRTYYDRAHWASTFNTDSGCAFAGYWRVLRWADVMKNDKFYYNLDEIGWKDFSEWFSGKRSNSYWKNVLSGCALNFPDAKTSQNAGGKYDNERSIADWYSNDMADMPIVLTEHFEKLIPKDHDLGDYPYEVWMRFIVAADDNVIFAEPMAYCPVVWYGYDYAEGRTNNASMSLEVLPFQDQFTNLLTQLLLTTRQNLANVTLMDTDVFEQKTVDEIKNWGEKFYRNVLNIVPISFRRAMQKQGSDLRQAVISHKYPMGDTQSIIQSMKVVLDTLERVLVMSAQEVGQTATHEQTREEVKNIALHTSTRVTFTSIGIDVGRDAWKRQIYYALMAHGQDEVWAQVPMDEPMDEAKLNELGFTVAGPYDPKNRRQYLKGNKTALAFESFASDRDGEDRVNDGQTAQQMLGFMDKVMANPTLFAAVGVEQCLAVLNQVAKFLGFPRDFKLVNTGQTQTMQDQVMEALQQVQAAMEQQIGALTEDIQGSLKEITIKNKDQDVTMKDIASRLNLLLTEANQIETPPLPQPSDSDVVPATDQDMILAIAGQ